MSDNAEYTRIEIKYFPEQIEWVQYHLPRSRADQSERLLSPPEAQVKKLIVSLPLMNHSTAVHKRQVVDGYSWFVIGHLGVMAIQGTDIPSKLTRSYSNFGSVLGYFQPSIRRYWILDSGFILLMLNKRRRFRRRIQQVPIRGLDSSASGQTKHLQTLIYLLGA